ncbi:hypothetical protein DL96DRAFT_1613503 [Flagelloscypha sp. PMI_526]|nr:hypothetical protein DL96DRAFT_1613503 [Flagelloscypha sp. PMI_526]
MNNWFESLAISIRKNIWSFVILWSAAANSSLSHLDPFTTVLMSHDARLSSRLRIGLKGNKSLFRQQHVSCSSFINFC